MKIERLQVDGFGHFFKYPVGPLDAPLTVLYGPNEAGKSTLLAFARTMLFGFPASKQAEFYPPLNGGAHGGRITLAGNDGRQYIVDRRAGPKGGPCTVTAGGQPVDDAAALSTLLGHASESMYRAVFAFGLAELQTLKSLNQADVGGRIYAAGMGASALPAALTSLTRKSDAIFKSGGSTQVIAKILGELSNVETDLDSAKRQAARYGDLVARREKIDEELDVERLAITDLRTRRGLAERLQKGWDDWVRLTGLEEELAGLAVIENFPEAADTRFDAAERRLADAESELTGAQQERDRVAEKAKTVVPDEDLLGQSELIDRIRERRGSFLDSVRDLPKRKAELRGLEESLGKALRDLGDGWDETRLDAFDISISVRDAVEQWRKRLDDCDRALHDAAVVVGRAEKVARDAAEKLAGAREALEKIAPPELDAGQLEKQRGALRTARSLLAEYRLAQQQRGRLEHQQEQIATAERRGDVLHLWLLAGGVGAGAGGLALGGAAFVLGAIVAVLLVGMAAYIVWRGRAGARDPSGVLAGVLLRQIEDAAREESAAGDALKGAVAPLGLAGAGPASEDLDGVEVRLDAAHERLAERKSALGRVDAAAEEEQRRRRESGEAKEAEEKARRARDEALARWSGWLAERELPGSLAPATVKEIFARVEAARAQREHVEDMRGRVKAIDKDIAEYQDMVAPLAARPGVSSGGHGAPDIGRAAETLVQRFEAARDAAARRRRYEEELEKAELDLEKRQRHMIQCREGIEEILRLAGTSDPEEFRRVATQQARRRELDHERRQCGDRLRVLSGPGDEFDAFRTFLAASNPDTLQSELDGIAADLAEAERRQGDLQRERGGVEEQLGQLVDDRRASELRSRRSVLVEQLQANAREWAALALAKALLERTRAKFEAERQPDVIKHAQGFFETVTGGRYRRLIAPLGQQTVTVEDRDGKPKTPEQLSRGTQEQLYLALRFGLIKEFGERASRLPVIVDEVLVNFDPARARRAAEAFAELARTNQVLVFTCHPETVELFKGVCADAQVVEIAAPDLFTSSGS